MIYYFCQKCEHYHVSTEQQLDFSRKHYESGNKISKPSETRTTASPFKLSYTGKNTLNESTVRKPCLTINKGNSEQNNSLTTSLIKDNKQFSFDNNKIVGNTPKSQGLLVNNSFAKIQSNDTNMQNKPQKIKCFGFQCGSESPIDSSQIPLRGHIGRKLHS